MSLPPVPPWMLWAAGGVVVLLIANKATGGKLVAGIAGGTVSAVGDAVAGVAGGVVREVTPTNPDNVFAKSADAIYEAITGRQGASMGSDAYDMTHNEDGSGKWWWVPGYFE